MPVESRGDRLGLLQGSELRMQRLVDGPVRQSGAPNVVAEPAEARGLTVPAMPIGSPGMEYNNQFMRYDVLLLKKDGSVEVYAPVESYAQQFK